MKPIAVVAAALMSLCSMASAQTAAIPGLFNTGVNDSRGLLGSGAIDPHYALTASPGGAFPNAVVADPIPEVWADNSATSQWIAPTVDQSLTGAAAPGGDYNYRLTFDLTGFDPATAQISGDWATDNSGRIFINGSATANVLVPPAYLVLVPFAVTSGFVAGINTLDFRINNLPGAGPNPTGLRVEDISGTAVAVIPEPGTYAMLATGLALLGFSARRRKGLARRA